MRPRLLARVTYPEVAGTRLEEPPPPLLGFRRRLFLQGLQVGQVGLAKGTTDGAQVKRDVILERRVEGLEEITPQLFAVGAAEPLPAPDRADGVFAAVTFLHKTAEHALERLRFTQCLLYLGRLGFA